MGTQDKRFGTYYGELIEINSKTELIFHDYSESDTKDLIENMLNSGVTKIFLDVEDGERYSSTMFFSTNKKTDFKELLLIFAQMRPSEFSEESEGNFRVWFD